MRSSLWLFALACGGTAVDTAPVPTDTAPPAACAATLGPADARTGDALVAEHDCGEGALVGWYLDNLAVVDLEGLVVPAERTARDDVWRVVVTPMDGAAQAGDPATATATVLNTAPELLTAALPDAPTAAVDIELTVTTADPDFDNVVVEVSWSVDGTEVVAASATALPAGLATRDQVVEAVVTPFDGTDRGAAQALAVTVVNAAPSVASADLGVARATPDDALTVQTEGWFDADGDPEGYRYAWRVDGAEHAETSDTLALTSVAVGSVVYCVVVPTDGLDDGASVSTAPVVVVAP